jgi:hypothetical protein
MSAGDTALVLLFTSGDDYQRIVRQPSLAPECFQGRCGHPCLDLVLCRQDHRHGFCVIRADERVRLGREKCGAGC